MSTPPDYKSVLTSSSRSFGGKSRGRVFDITLSSGDGLAFLRFLIQLSFSLLCFSNDSEFVTTMGEEYIAAPALLVREAGADWGPFVELPEAELEALCEDSVRFMSSPLMVESVSCRTTEARRPFSTACLLKSV